MPINPFDPFGSSNPDGKRDEIFARPVRGIGRPARRKADPAAADGLESEPEAADSRSDKEADYAGAAPNLVARRDHARAAIKAKAQAWTTRIDAKFNAAMDKWLADAAIPHNSIIGIRYYHPKYNITGDTATTE